MDEIEAGESQDGTVYNTSMRIPEKTTDILVAGGDPHFIRQKGMGCDFKWMLHRSKRQLYQFLDTTSCLRTDYRSLAEFLEVEDSVLEDIEKECSRSGRSYTEAIISHWTTATGKGMTFGLLYKALTHPGLVGNKNAAQVIETLMLGLGFEVGLFENQGRTLQFSMLRFQVLKLCTEVKCIHGFLYSKHVLVFPVGSSCSHTFERF